MISFLVIDEVSEEHLIMSNQQQPLLQKVEKV